MNALERHWYQPRFWLTVLLWPLECLFISLAAVRRWLFRLGVLKQTRLPVPVVIIGNINVGGVGKTPLTQALLAGFRQQGIKVGVISRGYGGSVLRPTLVDERCSAAEVGDEPLLLAASGMPVVVGRDRVAAAQFLLQQVPDVQLLLSDDGLQHYALGRSLEIVVLDGRRGIGNGHLLPAGPLRESWRRLRSVDAVVINGTGGQLPAFPPALPVFRQRLQYGAFEHLAGELPARQAGDFAGQRVVAMAGIGHPQRFFDGLQQLELRPAATVALPDHHDFAGQVWPEDADAIIVTAKDAVKLQRNNHGKLWVLPVHAQVEPDLTTWILSQLETRHGCKISRDSGLSAVQGPAASGQAGTGTDLQG